MAAESMRDLGSPKNRRILAISRRQSSKATLHDYDLVVVLGDGEVIEVGRPSALEEDPRSNFASMLAAERGGEHF